MDGKEMDHRRRIGVLYRGRSGYGCYKELHWTLAKEIPGSYGATFAATTLLARYLLGESDTQSISLRR